MGDVLLRRINGERETSVLGPYAYERYSHYAGGVDRLNRPLPKWEGIDETTRLRWIASANRISEIAGAYVGHRCQEGMGNAKDVLSGVITLDNLYLVPDAVLGLANGPFRLLSLISTSTENLVSPGENHIGTESLVRSVWSGMLRAGFLPDDALEALSASIKTIADEREAQRQKARDQGETVRIGVDEGIAGSDETIVSVSGKIGSLNAEGIAAEMRKLISASTLGMQEPIEIKDIERDGFWHLFTPNNKKRLLPLYKIGDRVELTHPEDCYGGDYGTIKGICVAYEIELDAEEDDIPQEINRTEKEIELIEVSGNNGVLGGIDTIRRESRENIEDQPKPQTDPSGPFSFQDYSPEPNLDRFRNDEPEPNITPANLLELLLRVVLVHAVASNGTNVSHTPELEAAWREAIDGWSNDERAEAHAYIAALEFAANGEPVDVVPEMPKCIEALPTNEGLEHANK
jgi:hypothetical protein